jgi:peptidoglycan/LPS O-acetylase OafA/YrhL
LASSALDERLLVSGDQAGTAPGDRRFRPDVEGLRAVAVLLVVFYHADSPGVTGGFVGVDVFFVISGFVITGVLLRERGGTGHTSIVAFYARRVRRILPAATLTILATVAASYALLGFVAGNGVADDGRWAAVFLANFHFESIGTNYFTATLPPSPLQNFWSLSVEEQFYLVYPTLFLVVASLRGRVSLHVRMAVVLSAVVAGSFWLSVTQTASAPTAAYFSPFTRAWELALGALVAVGTPWLKRLPITIAATLAWSGLVAIGVAAFTFTSATPYPGSLVAIPVVGAALVIGGGVAEPRRGAERLLGLGPFQWFGKRSYSLYLWHWPILIIAAEQAGRTSLPFRDTIWLLLLAVAVSMASYRLVENPIRHLRLPPKATVAAGAAVVLATVLALTLAITTETTPDAAVHLPIAPNTDAVLQAVAAARSIHTVPSILDPSLADVGSDYGEDGISRACSASYFQSTTEKLCVLGDVHGRRLLVVYGDSHAGMWLPGFDGLAKTAHMRLLVLSKPGCPAALVTISNPRGVGNPAGAFTACNEWHTWAVKTINRLAPSMLVVTQESGFTAPGQPQPVFSASEWADGLNALLAKIPNPRIEKVILGNIPQLAGSPPTCLAAHLNQVQACSTPIAQAVVPLDATEYAVARAHGIKYIDPTSWLCSRVCTAIVGAYDVYLDKFHITAAYATYLQNALAHALFSSTPLPTLFLERTTQVLRPPDGATLSGEYSLAANAVDGFSPVAKVTFELSGSGLRNRSICVATPTIAGWLCDWNTASVPNGHYDLRSVLDDATGHRTASGPVAVTVRN